jgi:hypothetical protein
MGGLFVGLVLIGSACAYPALESNPLNPPMVNDPSSIELVFYGLDYDTVQTVLSEALGANATPETYFDRAFHAALVLKVYSRADLGAIKAKIEQLFRRKGISGGVFLFNSRGVVVYGSQP